ncbi:MAG: hypothetical protein KDC34_05810 [Saprospiraceae bacterium]|nr:hypothetical protein [Saprospiraceae bacterium]
MLKTIAQGLSLFFHPLLMLTYMLLLLLLANPYLFGVNSIGKQTPLILLVFLSTFIIPAFAVVMMKFLGLVKSIHLHDRTERIGPYIITAIFYLWILVNFWHDSRIPIAYTSCVLGATIALFLAFFINNFSKISAHAVGLGGLLAMIVITMTLFSYNSFTIPFGQNALLEVRMSTVFLIAILTTGLVSSARLVLEAHDLQDIYGGLIIGFMSQFVALRILF